MSSNQDPPALARGKRIEGLDNIAANEITLTISARTSPSGTFSKSDERFLIKRLRHFAEQWVESDQDWYLTVTGGANKIQLYFDTNERNLT